MFARLLQELEENGELENTVIVAYTDHYTYGFKDEDMAPLFHDALDLSNVALPKEFVDILLQ